MPTIAHNWAPGVFKLKNTCTGGGRWSDDCVNWLPHVANQWKNDRFTSFIFSYFNKVFSQLIICMCQRYNCWRSHWPFMFVGTLHLLLGGSEINIFYNQVNDIVQSSWLNPCIFLWCAWGLIVVSNMCLQPGKNCSNMRASFALSCLACALSTHNRFSWLDSTTFLEVLVECLHRTLLSLWNDSLQLIVLSLAGFEL